MMIKKECVVIVLIYGETQDVISLNDSLKSNEIDYQIVVVESYSNERNKLKNMQISNSIGADYLCVENRGYGYGNNRGISFARTKYNFEYCIISNADVVVNKIDLSDIPKKNIVIGPLIKTLKNKNQNPYWAVNCKIANRIIYVGFKYRLKSFLFIGRAINKILRELFLLILGDSIKTVFALHGSFLIFSKDVINKYSPIFDDNSFLYNEEMWLANNMKKNSVKMMIDPKIRILHKEDGCSENSKIDFNECERKSYIYFYDKQR